MTSFDLVTRAARDLDRFSGTALRRTVPANDAPRYDVIRTDDERFAIVLAVPGYGDDELAITLEDGSLSIEGKPMADKPADGISSSQGNGVTYLRRGIGKRGFVQRFRLAPHVEVAGARLADGLLQLDLERRVPEAMKPRSIAINMPAAAAVAA